MIIRGLFVVALISTLIIVALFNPPPLPKVNTESRWVKINSNGKAMPAWAGPWKCVLDTKTQLLWEVKSYAEDIHDYQCSFSWYDGQRGEAKRGDCFIEGEGSDTADLIRVSNTARYCGATQWRLPTEMELRSLLIEKPEPGEPFIARDFFPYAKRGLYWSADYGKALAGHYEHLGEGATSFSFENAQSRNMPYRDAAFVRLVSSYSVE